MREHRDNSIDFSEHTFTSGAYIDRFVEKVSASLESSPAKILDLGCGTGSILIRLAKRYPDAECCGIDISPRNISLAQKDAAASIVSCRTYFVSQDYMTTSLPEFDLLVCYSTLHLMEYSVEDLVNKLALNTRINGTLIITIPGENIYNWALFVVRRFFRIIKSRFMDWLILQVGLIITRGSYSRQDLMDRVSYMYVIPNLVWSDDLANQFAGKGFSMLSCEPEPHASLAQPRHVLVVLRRSIQ